MHADLKFDLNALAAQILGSRKYRELEIPPETVLALLRQELPKCRSERDLVSRAREKLHQIIAPYLGDPDYAAAEASLGEAFRSGDPAQGRAACAAVMQAHASTRERIPYLDEFYARLFAVTGQPQAILDLACALHPLAFPWMGLPLATRYYAYDIHRPRVNFLNHYFMLQGLEPLAQVQDILLNPPGIEAEVGFFFKEAHRFEQRQRGCNRAFWQSLRVRWLLVSLPAASLTGRHDLAQQHRRLVYETLAGLDWPVTEVAIGNEIVFCIRKPA